MILQIEDYIKKWNMIREGEKILVGVSGGADSVCLCLVLKQLSEKYGFPIEVIHIEHGIRGKESVKDAEFVEQLCRRLNIPFHEERVNVPSYAREVHLSEEEAARVLRYRAFAKYGGKGVKIALAHHLEDNAETILFQMIRGSGLDGLCGMKPIREGDNGEIYIRPLLETGREEIEAYLASAGQTYCTDSTNENLNYSRNRIRKKVLPELIALNPQAVKHINSTAGRLGELRDHLDAELDVLQERIAVVHEEELELYADELSGLQPALRQRLIHRMIAKAAGRKKDIAGKHVQMVENLLFQQTGRYVDLPYGIVAERCYGKIVLGKKKSVQWKADENVCISAGEIEKWREEKETIRIRLESAVFSLRIFPFSGNMEEIPQKKYTKWLDYDMIKNGFCIRTRQQKDYFLFDKEGHHKKIEDYFVNEKIPAAQRERILLLAKDSQVFWIVDWRMGYGAEITDHTKNILEITKETD